jgi:predicted PurR-regulated permease PerM
MANYPVLFNSLNGLLSGGITTSLVVIPSVANFLFYAVLTLIISFYFITDKENISAEIYNLTPNSWHKEMKYVSQIIDTTFASFLRVQLVFGVLAGIFTWVILMLFHVDFAVSAALLAGILTLVPLLGPVLGIIPPLLVTLFFAANSVIPVFILLLIIQQIIFNVIGPKLLSNAFKIHPVVVLLSFIVGLKLAGGIGAVLAVPVLGIATIVIHRVSKHFLSSSN